MSGNTTNDEEKEKKAYVKPVLDSAIVYEASGATCCKVTADTCSIANKGSFGKGNKNNTAS
jgi:hypothetical protein